MFPSRHNNHLKLILRGKRKWKGSISKMLNPQHTITVSRSHTLPRVMEGLFLLPLSLSLLLALFWGAQLPCPPAQPHLGICNAAISSERGTDLTPAPEQKIGSFTTEVWFHRLKFVQKDPSSAICIHTALHKNIHAHCKIGLEPDKERKRLDSPLDLRWKHMLLQRNY